MKRGQKILQKPEYPLTEECLKHKEFSAERASCIYRHAAAEAGIVDSKFFTEDSLNRTRPPGWVEYLSREIGDRALYDSARKEINKLRDQILQAEMQGGMEDDENGQ